MFVLSLLLCEHCTHFQKGYHTVAWLPTNKNSLRSSIIIFCFFATHYFNILILLPIFYLESNHQWYWLTKWNTFCQVDSPPFSTPKSQHICRQSTGLRRVGAVPISISMLHTSMITPHNPQTVSQLQVDDGDTSLLQHLFSLNRPAMRLMEYPKKRMIYSISEYTYIIYIHSM